jgi:ATP-binding cassette, subfamily B, bacterial PglK
MHATLDKLRVVLDRRAKRGMVLGTLASTVIAVFDMVAIALVLPLVNLAGGERPDHPALELLTRALGISDQRTLTLVVAALVVGLFIVKDLLSMAFAWWLGGFKAFNRARLSARLLYYYLRAPYLETARRSTGDLIRTMSEAVIQVYGSVVYSLMNLVNASLAVVAIVLALLWSAPVPTVALIAYLGIASLMYLLVMRPRVERAGSMSAEATAASWRGALAALGAKKETKLRSSEEFFVTTFREASMRGARATRLAEFIGAVPRFVLEILFIVAVGVILATSTSNSAVGDVGVVALFVAAGFRILPNITLLVGAVNSLRFGMPFLDLVHADMVSMRDLPPVSDSPSTPRHLSREIRVQGVTFSYPGSSRPALDAVTLVVPKGSSVALVGGSGAGKSTLVDVILGLFEPQAGGVVVDGTDIREDLPAWQAGIGYVPQEVFLLDGTLAENIAFDRHPQDIDQELLRECIARAQLDDLVASLPDGVRTQLGEGGSRLSGGQRQRVGIARALYRRPSLLVLDEATSALDNETEHRVAEAVYGLSGEVTVLVVAHRLSTVKNVDEVVLLEDGRVRATGTFTELRARSDAFDRLVRLGSMDD